VIDVDPALASTLITLKSSAVRVQGASWWVTRRG
jgi:hypothetical protein